MRESELNIGLSIIDIDYVYTWPIKTTSNKNSFERAYDNKQFLPNEIARLF